MSISPHQSKKRHEIMNQLFLCEKSSQAKTLAEHLGSTAFVGGAWHGPEGTVVAAQGHLLEMDTLDAYLGKGKWNLAVLPYLPNKWKLQVLEDEHIKNRFQTIGNYLNQAEHVIVATDPDEQGELIARDLLNEHKYKGKVSRLWVSALNSDGLAAALANLRPLSETDGYFRAASMQRKLDWLFGMNLSRAFSVQFGKTVRIGRVKTQLLAALVQHDREIAEFKAVNYHSVSALSKGGEVLRYVAGTSVPAVLDADVISKLNRLTGAKAVVTSVVDYPIEVAPPLPYSLSALLADATSTGISLTNGMAATQKLYELGAISYPRSGSTELPSADNTNFSAHSAIVVTGTLPEDATDEMAFIFNLVQNNLQMNKAGAATIHRRTIFLDVGGHVFKLQHQWLVPGKEGFVSAMRPENPQYEKYQTLSRLPAQAYKKGAKLTIAKVQVNKLATVAPSSFTEASMLKMMSENGIGTEATRVNSINSLLRDGVAAAIAQTDERGVALHAPMMLRATEWANELVDNLPASVLGSDMSNQVKVAQNALRGNDIETDRFLIDATKWILRVMPQEEDVAA